ncbi:MAG: hypothetical protein E7638_03810 [Ruminococcaceae bacterium]|nr:hypothetical protein [Oscillospiraceae bacterium]
MKKFLSVFVTVLMLVQMVYIPAAADATDVTFTISDAQAKPGETVTVELSVASAGTSYNSVAVSGLTYDKSALTFDGFTDYSAIEEKWTLGACDNAKQSITMAFSKNVVLNEYVCKLNFTVAADAPDGEYSVVMSSVIKDKSTVLTSQVIPGKITVTHTHTDYAVATEAVEATCATAGHIAYWTCGHCGKIFSDAACTVEVTAADIAPDYNPENHEGEFEIRDDVAGDCGNDGYTGDTYCKACDTMTEEGTTIPATGLHTGDGEWFTDEAQHWHICGTCGDLYDEGKHEGGEADCIALALCDICTTEYGDLNPTNHKGETELIDVIPATCSDPGYTGDLMCLDCGELIELGEIIEATGEHVDADGEWTTDADNHWHICGCGEVFDKTAHNGGEATCAALPVCADCGVEYGDFDLTNHAGETELIDAAPATCSDDGYTGDLMCLGCGEIITFGEIIEATGDHVDADGEWTTDGADHWHICGCGEIFDKAAHNGGEATCTAKAVCSDCGVEYGTVNASNHKGDTEVRDAKPATCSEDGYTGDTYCLTCGAKIADGEVIAATGEHVDADDAWETDGTNHWHTCGCGAKFDEAAHEGGEATCTAKAVCSVCGVEYGEVSADNHTGETEVRDAKTPTCSEDGYTGDTYCLACDAKIADGEVIEATGEHVDADDTWKTDAENHWHICGCGEKFDEAAHEGGEANCITKAVCDVCGVEYGDVNADVHGENTEIRDAKEATCFEEGLTGETWCLDCNTKIKDSEVIPTTGDHTWGDWDVDSKGNAVRKCELCGTEDKKDADSVKIPVSGDVHGVEIPVSVIKDGKTAEVIIANDELKEALGRFGITGTSAVGTTSITINAAAAAKAANVAEVNKILIPKEALDILADSLKIFKNGGGLTITFTNTSVKFGIDALVELSRAVEGNVAISVDTNATKVADTLKAGMNEAQIETLDKLAKNVTLISSVDVKIIDRANGASVDALEGEKVTVGYAFPADRYSVQNVTVYTIDEEGKLTAYTAAYYANRLWVNVPTLTTLITAYEKSPASPDVGGSNGFYDDWFWVINQLQGRKITITATAGEGGTISNVGTKTIMLNSIVKYTITPYAGYEIDAVYVNGVDVGAVSEYTFNKAATNQTIRATFKKIVEEKVEEIEEGWKNPFIDVSNNASYIDAIEFVYENGLFKGVSATEFEPDTTMTRAMFVTVLGRMAGVDTSLYTETTFSDVVAGEWYSTYVEWAASKGIVLGYGDGTFGVEDEITIEQAAVIIARFAKFIEVYEASDLDLAAFADGELVSDWATAEMKWAIENEIYGGTNGLLYPESPASRALIAVMLYNFARTFE